MRARVFGIVIILLALSAAAFDASAGGPFVVDDVNNSGRAQGWKDDELKWCADPGDLSSTVSHSQAVGWITEAFGKWSQVKLRNASNQSIDTANISISKASSCPTEDIDISNFTDYYNGDAGPTVVVFDDTGDIVAEIVGEENREVVVGLSVPLVSDSAGLNITKGIAIFNGLLLASDNTTLGYDLSTKSSYFKCTVLHELGHLLNLDHSQTNYEYVKNCELGSSCEYGSYIPTMYPELVNTTQGNLNRDDQVTISWLYPTQDFEDEFCVITGKIYDGDGRPLKGVHVTATRTQGTTTPLVEARSFVSGALYPSCSGDSRYYLFGIVPGRSYRVTYEAIGSQFRGASDFEPLDNPPTGFDSGVIPSGSGGETVSCDSGGETIEMADLTIDTGNPCASSSGSGSGSGTTTTSSSSCTLVRGALEAAGAGALVMILAALAALVPVRIKRKDG